MVRRRFFARRVGFRRRLARIPPGRLAQLEEHLVYTQKVGGSIPSPPTTTAPKPFQIRDGLSGRGRVTSFSGKGEPASSALLMFQDNAIHGRSPV